MSLLLCFSASSSALRVSAASSSMTYSWREKQHTVSLLADKSSTSAPIDSRWVIGRRMDSDEGQRGAGALRGRRLYFSPNWGGGRGEGRDRWCIMEGWLNKCTENRKLHPSELGRAVRAGRGWKVCSSSRLWWDFRRAAGETGSHGKQTEGSDTFRGRQRTFGPASPTAHHTWLVLDCPRPHKALCRTSEPRRI